MVALRRAHQHADDAAAGRRRPDLHASGTRPRSARPTRSCFLTGRNHHQNGYACIAEGATGFPGSTGTSRWRTPSWPRSCARRAGTRSGSARTTTCRRTPWAWARRRRSGRWRRGFDRFYGFIGGETNQWYPDLVEDNHYVDQPYLPEDGYHLSKDLADKAITFIADCKQSRPDKPWYMLFCPGANHAPHHAPQEYIDKYKGTFDDGYEAYREWVLPRMIEQGILPEGTELSPINPMPEGTFSPLDMVRPWASLSDDEKTLFSRMAEVYAGFSEYTDAQVGRIVDYLEESGQLDNTLIFYCADNGASGEGTPERLGQREQVLQRLARRPRREPGDARPARRTRDLQPLPDRAGPSRSRRRSACSSATRTRAASATRMVIHWPKGIKAKGEVRNQYHHAIDIVPTILECCGIEFPEFVHGLRADAAARRLDEVQLRRRRRADDQAARSTTRCSARAASGTTAGRPSPCTARRRASATSTRTCGSCSTPTRTAPRPTTSPAEHPEKVEELVGVWFAEAGKYDVLPLDDRTPARDHRWPSARRRSRRGGVVRLLPGHARSSRSARPPNIRGRSYRILADVEIDGRRHPGRDRRPGLALRRPLPVRQGRQALVRLQLHRHPARAAVRLATSTSRRPPRRSAMEFTKESLGDRHETHGTAKLYVDDKVVAEGRCAPSRATSPCAARACPSAATPEIR